MRSGYTFVGWSLAPTYKNTMTEAAVTARLKTKTGQETWYAVWIPNMVEVWYRTDAGTVDSADFQLLGTGRIARRDRVGWAPTRIFYNSTTPLLTADELGLKREGYTFVGWTLNGKSMAGESAIKRLAAAQFRTKVELTAVWEENTEPETSAPETSAPETSAPESSGPSGPSGPVGPKREAVS